MRTIKELLQIMLDNQDLFVSGLCTWVAELLGREYFSFEEYRALKKYIRENEPRHVNKADFYWWKVGDIAPRIKWIKEQIKKLENEP